ncbi:MAG TPA: GNAT family N-acetyltransferase [Acidimicrobiia bacterium]
MIDVEAIASIGPVSRWTDEQTRQLRQLTEAVYPPEEEYDWPGAALEWSRPEMGVRVVDAAGWLVSYVGVLTREALHDGNPVLIGGIGGVKTHPDHRGMGLAALGMEKATQWLFEHAKADFGLLVCQDELLGYYGRMGWKVFEGTLLTKQRGEKTVFTFNRVMTRDMVATAPTTGVLDLQGPAW